MQYFFTLGSNLTLSIAELSAVFPSAKLNLINKDALLLETNYKINPQKLIKRLGGTIKIGKIESEVNKKDREKILMEIKKLLKPTNGKFKFGISYYGKKKINIKPLAMEIKKYLREQNVNSRWVTSKEPTLSSVVVEQNKLTTKGIEIILIKNNEQLLIGRTLAVQPFKELSFRDYGRPARDDYAGMLPPKLARIMINLALSPSHCQGESLSRSGTGSRGEILLDPFCGSGTILTEAMLMGYTNLIGSDISKKAISNTNKNINWTKDKFQITPPRNSPEGQANFKFQLYNKNATELSRLLKSNSIDIIITEPYLGPPRGKFDIKNTVHELEQLYSKSLIEFKKILKPNGKIVMIWPIFRITHKVERITPNLNGFKIVNPIPGHLRSNKEIKLTDRETIVYGRPDQKIWREIMILK